MFQCAVFAICHTSTLIFVKTKKRPEISERFSLSMSQFSLGQFCVHGSGSATTVTHSQDYGSTATYNVTTCKDCRY